MKKLFLRKAPLGERGDMLGWTLITLMTVVLAVLIWGIASERLVEIFSCVMDSIAGI